MKKTEELREQAIRRLRERGWLNPSEGMIMKEMTDIQEIIEPTVVRKKITLAEYKANKDYWDNCDEPWEIGF